MDAHRSASNAHEAVATRRQRGAEFGEFSSSRWWILSAFYYPPRAAAMLGFAAASVSLLIALPTASLRL